MIFLVVFFAGVGAWEAYVYHSHRYPEDICLTVACFGAAVFLLAMKMNGAGV